MKQKVFLGVSLAMFFIVAGCGDSGQNNVSEGKSKTTDTSGTKEATFSLKTQEGMEKKLNELNFPIYPGAEFKEVKDKVGKYTIVYKIPELTDEMNKKVDDFYREIFEGLKQSGWESVMEKTSHFDYLYRKGSESITFTHNFMPEYKIHEIYISYQ